VQLVTDGQWAIFARCHERYEAGTVGPDTHPGQGGIDARYHELAQVPGAVPSGTRRRAVARARAALRRWHPLPGSRGWTTGSGGVQANTHRL